MNRSSRTAALVSALAVSVILGPVAGGTASIPTAGRVPLKLVGTWTRTVTAADVRREHATDIHNIRLARSGWTIQIQKSGAASLFGPDYFTGPVSSAGANRVNIYLGFHYPNVYKWRVSGRLLTLTKVSDSFALRAAVLHGVWKRKRP
jgi:hypothetical protein